MKCVLDRGIILILGVAVGVLIASSFMDGEDIVVIHPALPKADEAVAHDAQLMPHLGAAVPLQAGVDAMWVDPPADACPTPLPEKRARAIAAGSPVEIAVMGDSFGDGIWAALYREFARDSGYSVRAYSKVGSGMASNGDGRMEKRADAAFLEHDPDIIVVALGGNDNQGLMYQGKAYRIFSEDWNAIYRNRVRVYGKYLERNNARVYWLGLPIMRDAKYDLIIATINQLIEAEMRGLGISFLRTRALSADASGNYQQYFINASTGKRTLLRAKDGIHMSAQGYSHIVRPLVERIRTCVGSARGRYSGVDA